MKIESGFQQGIVAPASSHALFITLNVEQIEQRQQLLNIIGSLPIQLAKQQAAHADAELFLNIALSSSFWDILELPSKPRQLKPFLAIENERVAMPASNAHLLLHIRSNRHDVNYHFSQILRAQLSPFLKVDDMVHGFCYLDSRDLTGFVDGTENPYGDNRVQVALVNDDNEFNQGSYVHLQKYVHNIPRWEQLSLAEQEASYGRSKVENIEFSATQKSSCAHTKRASVKDKHSNSVEILRQSLPWADQHAQGLMFASFAASPDNFNLMLQSMCQIDQSAQCDAILNVSKAVSGDAFFAPPLRWFKHLIKSS